MRLPHRLNHSLLTVSAPPKLSRQHKDFLSTLDRVAPLTCVCCGGGATVNGFLFRDVVAFAV